MKLKSEDELRNVGVILKDYNNYNNALRFADYKYKAHLEKYNIISQTNLEKRVLEEKRSQIKKLEEALQKQRYANEVYIYEKEKDKFSIGTTIFGLFGVMTSIIGIYGTVFWWIFIGVISIGIASICGKYYYENNQKFKITNENHNKIRYMDTSSIETIEQAEKVIDKLSEEVRGAKGLTPVTMRDMLNYYRIK